MDDSVKRYKSKPVARPTNIKTQLCANKVFELIAQQEDDELEVLKDDDGTEAWISSNRDRSEDVYKKPSLVICNNSPKMTGEKRADPDCRNATNPCHERDMKRSRIEEKHSRNMEPQIKALKFIPGLTLSQHPPEQRKNLFLWKFINIMNAKSLHPTEFEGYTIRERFAKMGWEQLLNFQCDKIYKRVVIQWTATLSRNGDKLTGVVDGKSYTITPAVIRDLLKVDTRTDLPYVRFKEADLLTTTDENKVRWREACRVVFGTHEDVQPTNGWYPRSKMTPVVQVLWRIGVSTFHPRFLDYLYSVSAREIYLLHALFTGDYLYSFAHLMIDDIWDMYEHEHKKFIPHGYYISEILNRLGAVSKDESGEVVPPLCRLITRETFFPDLRFSESPAEYIIVAGATQRVTFPKKVKQGEAPRKFPQQPLQSMTSNKQSSHSEKQHTKLITMIENQALEAEFREQEIESRAEIRAHAIIWDIERQRYFYEQEQRNLRMAWNQDIMTQTKAMRSQRHFSLFMATYMAQAARYQQRWKNAGGLGLVLGKNGSGSK
ncbi:hypothetical protein CTI12_AA188720 [Artemisia annua]|uniref:Uncharacterized protein n=1 Tax=Artemisia annua TaxID=35608 RepID=A0A2U1P6L3_ARTAN|nr:hypothetical protein CTI12_AA188720 [Artemisia annua]